MTDNEIIRHHAERVASAIDVALYSTGRIQVADKRAPRSPHFTQAVDTLKRALDVAEAVFDDMDQILP